MNSSITHDRVVMETFSEKSQMQWFNVDTYRVNASVITLSVSQFHPDNQHRHLQKPLTVVGGKGGRPRQDSQLANTT